MNLSPSRIGAAIGFLLILFVLWALVGAMIGTAVVAYRRTVDAWTAVHPLATRGALLGESEGATTPAISSSPGSSRVGGGDAVARDGRNGKVWQEIPSRSGASYLCYAIMEGVAVSWDSDDPNCYGVGTRVN
jgi:hypothetical protein